MTRGTKLTTALWLLLAAPVPVLAADSSGSGPGQAGSKAATGDATRAGQQAGQAAGGPRSPAQPGVMEDLRDGRQQCQALSGKERAACEARATATAETPRGREGANPTGSSRPTTGSGSSGR